MNKDINMQKFTKGDLVRVAEDLGEDMSHFENDCNAIVIGSYAEQYGGNDYTSYTIYIENHGKTSWYDENQLVLIEKNRLDLLQKWEQTKKEEKELKSNLDWIFDNGKEVLKNSSPYPIEALAKCIGNYTLWGSQGEGFIYARNLIAVLTFAKPFLLTKDKKGYLEACKKIKENSQK